jgi:hypothetical protein
MTKSRVNADNASADIQGVTAGTGLTGGGTSGTVTLTNDMATVIDAKGDLVVGTGADTYDNLAAGSNGDTLVADSSTSTGLRWQGSAIGKNAFYNSAFNIWQRGTSFAILGNAVTYTADRWFGFRAAGGSTISRQTGSNNSQYDIRIQRNSGETSTNAIFLAQAFEIADCTQYQGKTVTWSFWARSGSNYSAASNALTVVFLTGTGTTEGNPFVVGYTGQTAAINTSVTLTTSWQRFSVTATLGATVTQFNPYFQMEPSGTAGANDFFEVSNVQLELGSVATAYSSMTGTIQGELAACQRYYFRMTPGSAYGPIGGGLASSATSAEIDVTNAVQMRVAPTAVEYANIALHLPGVVIKTFTSLALVYTGLTNQTVLTSGSTGLTQSQFYKLTNNNNASAYIAFSAEL